MSPGPAAAPLGRWVSWQVRAAGKQGSSPPSPSDSGRVRRGTRRPEHPLGSCPPSCGGSPQLQRPARLSSPRLPGFLHCLPDAGSYRCSPASAWGGRGHRPVCPARPEAQAPAWRPAARPGPPSGLLPRPAAARRGLHLNRRAGRPPWSQGPAPEADAQGRPQGTPSQARVPLPPAPGSAEARIPPLPL